MAIELIRTKSDGQTICGVLHLPREPSPPCVIASHGLLSHKDSEKFVEIAEYFSARGVAVIRYDHRGCGESEGELRETTVTSRLADLEAIFALAVDHPSLGKSIGLLGSSMGGFISIFKGAADPRVKALALWATPAYLRGTRERFESEIKEAGGVILNDSFYEDAARYDGREAIRDLERCLILHGGADELVPASHAEQLFALAGSPKHLEIFPGGDHRFTDPECRQKAVALSFDWFKRFL